MRLKSLEFRFPESESANYSTPTHNKLLHCKLLWDKPLASSSFICPFPSFGWPINVSFATTLPWLPFWCTLERCVATTVTTVLLLVISSRLHPVPSPFHRSHSHNNKTKHELVAATFFRLQWTIFKDMAIKFYGLGSSLRTERSSFMISTVDPSWIASLWQNYK